MYRVIIGQTCPTNLPHCDKIVGPEKTTTRREYRLPLLFYWSKTWPATCLASFQANSNGLLGDRLAARYGQEIKNGFGLQRIPHQTCTSLNRSLGWADARTLEGGRSRGVSPSLFTTTLPLKVVSFGGNMIPEGTWETLTEDTHYRWRKEYGGVKRQCSESWRKRASC